MSAETLAARIREHCPDCRSAWLDFVDAICENTLSILAAHEQEQQPTPAEWKRIQKQVQELSVKAQDAQRCDVCGGPDSEGHRCCPGNGRTCGESTCNDEGCICPGCPACCSECGGTGEVTRHPDNCPGCIMGDPHKSFLEKTLPCPRCKGGAK